jgi:hypothetical protein
MNAVNKARQSAVTVTGRDEGSRLRNGELFRSDLSARRRGHLREMSYPQMAITWSEFEVGGATMPAGSARLLPPKSNRKHADRGAAFAGGTPKYPRALLAFTLT